MPIVVRNFEGEICTFLNVCPHRHSLLTNLPSGRSQAFACQYHGWEFNKDGKTGRIPDAASFRPLHGGPECLRKFPTRQCGPLVLAQIDPDAPPTLGLPQTLMSVAEEYARNRWHLSKQWSYSFSANWKVVVENTIETYHADTVHPRTLVFGQGKHDLDHELHDWGSVLRANLVNSSSYYRFADLWLSSIAPESSHQYRLHQFFPSLFWIRIDAMLQVMNVIPTSPTTCRLNVAVFVLTSQRANWFNRPLTKGWGLMKCRIIKRILAEDAALYPGIQQGIEASPFQGTISMREELVHAFQNYVARQCEL